METADDKEHQILRKLEQKYFCEQCQKPCIVLGGSDENRKGEHYNLTAADLAKWAQLIVSI